MHVSGLSRRRIPGAKCGQSFGCADDSLGFNVQLVSTSSANCLALLPVEWRKTLAGLANQLAMSVVELSLLSQEHRCSIRRLSVW